MGGSPQAPGPRDQVLDCACRVGRRVSHVDSGREVRASPPRLLRRNSASDVPRGRVTPHPPISFPPYVPWGAITPHRPDGHKCDQAPATNDRHGSDRTETRDPDRGQREPEKPLTTNVPRRSWSPAPQSASFGSCRRSSSSRRPPRCACGSVASLSYEETRSRRLPSRTCHHSAKRSWKGPSGKP